jgi:FAD synthase
MTEKEIEELWRTFFKEYLDNIVKILPQSYRAKQLEAKGVDAMLVYEFETRFLKKPFEKAILAERKRIIKKLKK